jgi:hypothetical protein
MPDISNLAEFGWYDPVWYVNYKPDDDAQTVHLGRYLGPSFEFGQELCYKVLNRNACVLLRSSVFSLTDEDRRSAGQQRRQRRVPALAASLPTILQCRICW